MSETDGKRPLSFIEDEQIEIKPSTELIPDEYERKNNGNVLVELVVRERDENADDLEKELTKLGFSVNKTYFDNKPTASDEWIKKFIATVNDKTKETNYDGLLMIFAKVQFKNETLKYIWGSFISIKCPALKNKPKIFIFQIVKRGLLADSAQVPFQTDLKMAYDTPSEADMLVVYDKIPSGSSNDFIENFLEHIKEYCHEEDIVTIVSLSLGSSIRPLIISTMTRKFFFTVNEYRGHHHNINESQAEIKERLEKIMVYVKNIPDHKPKEKTKWNSIKKVLSFRSNHNQGKESPKGETSKIQNIKPEKSAAVQQDNSGNDNKPTIKIDPPVSTTSKEKPKPLKPPDDSTKMPPPTKSPIRRTSTPSSPTTKIPVRTRTASASFYNSKEDLKKKPPWK